MSRKISIITASLICVGVSTGTYFLGRSSAPEHPTNLTEATTKRPARNSPEHRDIRDANNRSAVGRALRELREQGPTATIERIFSINDPLKRSDALRQLLDEMPSDEYTAFIEAFRKSGLARENLSDYRMALYSWAQKDPITALAYAEENTTNHWTRQTLLAAWAQYDATGAEAWALSHFDGQGANPWIVGVIEGVVTSDLNKATRLLTSLPFGRERGDALSKVMPVVGKLGADEAIAWLDSIEDERLKNGATRRLANQLGNRDPKAAITWAEGIENSELKLQTITEIAAGWLRQDLESSVAYVQKLPQETQISMARDLANDFGRQDFDKAANWLDSLGTDPRIDEAKMRLGWSSLRGSNRDKAVELIRNIADSDSPEAGRAMRTLERIERFRAR